MRFCPQCRRDIYVLFFKGLGVPCWECRDCGHNYLEAGRTGDSIRTAAAEREDALRKVVGE